MSADTPQSQECFVPASEFYAESVERPTDDGDPVPYAQGIIWFDQVTPIFACAECAPALSGLKWTGDETADDYEEIRADAYRTLFEADPRCDVCSGDLPDALEPHPDAGDGSA